MYELCCDMIDLLINMSEIYGQPSGDSLRDIDDDNIINPEHGYVESIEPVMNGDHSPTTNSYSNSKNST